MTRENYKELSQEQLKRELSITTDKIVRKYLELGSLFGDMSTICNTLADKIGKEEITYNDHDDRT